MPLDNCGDENRESPATNHPRQRGGNRENDQLGRLGSSGFEDAALILCSRSFFVG